MQACYPHDLMRGSYLAGHSLFSFYQHGHDAHRRWADVLGRSTPRSSATMGDRPDTRANCDNFEGNEFLQSRVVNGTAEDLGIVTALISSLRDPGLPLQANRS